MKFHIYAHHTKHTGIRDALLSAGHEETSISQAKTVFVHNDTEPMWKFLDELKSSGKKLVHFPHAGRPSLYWNNPYKPYGKFDLAIFPTELHEKVGRILGFEAPGIISGWSISPVRETRTSISGSSVLFAPIHPNGNGYLSSFDKALNRLAFQLMLSRGHLEITVRHYGTLDGAGLSFAPGVKYIKSDGVVNEKTFDGYDFVVSTQTFGYCSVAFGVPTYFYGESIPPRVGASDKDLYLMEMFSDIKDLVLYPFDFIDMPTLYWHSRHQDEWKSRMIGPEIDKAKFAEEIITLLGV